ncbi:hypothetical protein ADH66_05730 [Acutalibacter muris]|uniref:Uncharacterized protein n=1 Tax=Acutalibacter muris TaxID=1796620 RepID=A0ABN5A0H0_9FIRM|nr:hypothetical protein A4V00_03275 [Hungateiclostridiaceae bacterium KB18]ASB40200.1 hypothetical protein ADH66_05730 [Acutalibacter muris]
MYFPHYLRFAALLDAARLWQKYRKLLYQMKRLMKAQPKPWKQIRSFQMKNGHRKKRFGVRKLQSSIPFITSLG